ncbi:MAG: MAPEG family protein [Beijerinckiaceae bacterium]|nr:MAPEG family protein [Beijerinckiaceae bacterium]
MPIFLNENGQGLVGFTSASSWAASYMAILMVMAVVLAGNVARQRKPKRIGIGDGGDHTLLRSMRVHGNFVENVPFALAALVMLPLLGAPVWAVHVVGVSIVLGRILHAIGLNGSAGASAGRVSGMILTWLSLLFSAALLLWLAWR